MNLQLDQNQIGLGWEWGEYNEWEKAKIQRKNKNVYIIFNIVLTRCSDFKMKPIYE